MRYGFGFCAVAILVVLSGMTGFAAGSGSTLSTSRRIPRPTSPVAGGPASSFHVTIYNSAMGKPGTTILGGPFDVVPTLDSAGTVTLDFPTAVRLTPGTIWIAAYANMDSDLGQWYWCDNNTRHGGVAQWRNPGGGFGTTCTDWTSTATCFGDATAGPDLLFQIWGSVVGSNAGGPILLYNQFDGTSDSCWVAQNFETAMDAFDCELADCWGTLRGETWDVTRVILPGTYSGGDPCLDFTSLIARCVGGGMVQARVTLLNNISHTGEVVTFQVDGTGYTATIGDNGTHSRAQISVAGYSSGAHTVELVDPVGCFTPRVVTCPTGVAKADAEWAADDALWSNTAEAAIMQEVDAGTKLLGNHPNPFNPSTTISYGLGEDGFVTLKIYNTLGEEVATLVNGFQAAGLKSATWDGRNNAGAPVASGIYIYRLTAGDMVKSEKMMLMK